MKSKIFPILIFISLLLGCQTEEALPPLVPQYGKLVVFDGDKVIQGKGFALPRGISAYSVSYESPHTNKNHLGFDLKFDQGWTGCGWNWNAWNGDGNNIKGFKNLIFYINVSPCNISNLSFQLTSKDKLGGPDGMGPKVCLFPEINKKRGKYIKIIIPIDKLIGGSLDESSVWGFNIGVFSSSYKSASAKKSKSNSCRIYIDQMEFVQ